MEKKIETIILGSRDYSVRQMVGQGSQPKLFLQHPGSGLRLALNSKP